MISNKLRGLCCLVILLILPLKFADAYLPDDWNYSKTDYIFTIEPWGQLEPKEMVKAAIEAIKSKSKEFAEKINKK